MTNEEARTALGDRNNLLWGMSKEEQEYYSEALDMAISALSTEGEYIKKEDLIRKLNAWDCKAHGIPNYAWRVINDLPTVSFPNREKGEWIPVSERLPEESGRYLAYIVNEYDEKLQYIMTADYIARPTPIEGLSPWYVDDECASDNVVAWQPLPEPYMRGKAE